MRVTNQSLSRQVTTELQQAFRRLAEAQQAVASGKRINRLSDDPTAAVRALNLRGTAAALEQYNKNIDGAQPFLQQGEAVLAEAGEVLGRAKELTLAAVNDTNSAQDRLQIAAEVAQLSSQLLSLANSKAGDRYLFGGFKNGAAPFVQAPAGVNYTGDGNAINVQADASTTVTINQPGNKVFQGAGVTGGVGLFDVLRDLQTVLQSGGGTLPLSVSLAVNLDATAVTPGSPFPAGPDDTPANWQAAGNFSTTVALSDSLGQAHDLTLLFRKTGATTWDYRVLADRKELDAGAPASTDLRQVGSGTLTFNGAGALTSSTGSVGPLAWVNGASGQSIAAADLKFTGSTQLAQPSAVNTLSQTNTTNFNAQLGRLDAALEQVTSFRTEGGTRLKATEAAKERLALLTLQTTTLRAQTEDADALQVYSDFARLQQAFEAALQSAARVVQPSLLDFLR